MKMVLIGAIAIGVCIGALAAAVFVTRWSAWGLDVVKGTLTPILELFAPIKNLCKKAVKKLDDCVCRWVTPSYVRTWGDWKIIAFLILAVCFAIVRGILICVNSGGMDLLQRIGDNTIVGSFSALTGDSFSVAVCLRLVVIVLVTDFFIEHCKKLPIAVQLLYDVLFIACFALIFDLIKDSIFDFVPQNWWNMFQIDFDYRNLMREDSNAFVSVMKLLYAIWGFLLNFLLKLLTVVVGVVIFLKAIGDILSSFFCGIASYAFVISMGLLLQPLPLKGEVFDAILTVLALFCIVGMELLALNLDKIFNKKYKEAQCLQQEENEPKASGNKLPYHWLLTFFTGYFASPIFYFVLVCILSMIQEGYNTFTTTGAIYLICIFLLICMPCFFVLKRNVIGHGERWKRFGGFVLRVLLFYPICFITVIKWVFWLIQAVVMRLNKEKAEDFECKKCSWLFGR